MESFKISPTIGGCILVPKNPDNHPLLSQLLEGDPVSERIDCAVAELVLSIRDVAKRMNLGVRVCGARKCPTVQLWEKPAVAAEPVLHPFEDAGEYAGQWGITDLYEDQEKALVAVLASGAPFDTEWYGAKKEIEYGRISRARRNGPILVQARDCSMDEALELADTAVWRASGGNKVCGSGRQHLANLGLSDQDIETVLEDLAEASEIGDDWSTERGSVLHWKSGLARIKKKLDEMMSECNAESTQVYEGFVELTAERLKAIRRILDVSCFSCKYFLKSDIKPGVPQGNPDQCRHPTFHVLLSANPAFPFKRGCKFYEAKARRVLPVDESEEDSGFEDE